jgi:hypothetical protein
LELVCKLRRNFALSWSHHARAWRFASGIAAVSLTDGDRATTWETVHGA